MRWAASLLSCSLILGNSGLPGQSPPAKTPGQPDAGDTIKSTTRIVVVDVLVTDKAGKPVRGLKAPDFTVLEDGKPQQVKGLEERAPEMSGTSRPVALNLPPNTYTNYVTTRDPGAVNILLFDLLNTDRESLASARQQLLLYLSKLPGNVRVALFTLDGELHLVHGFTDDPRELIESAQQLSSSPHPMYGNSRSVSEALAGAREAGLTKSPAMYRAMTSFLWSEKEGKDESRTFVTMEALNQLARSMAVFAGRKNLIWISGGLPFDPTSTAPQMQKTASLLAATQIAVYPIDVRGVTYLGADGVARSSEVYAPFGGSYDEMSGQKQELLSVHDTMTSLATLTGGRAYFNRNDLQGAIRDSVESGSNYYTLAYRPQNDNWNGKFRKITVKASTPNVKVQCRPGYYAVPDPLGSPNIDRTFSLAMQPAAPASTTLIIKTQVLSPEEPEGATQIDFLVDVHDLSLTELDDHRQTPDVMFVAAVWDATGKPGGSVSATYHQVLSPAQLELLMRTGLRFHEELQVKPGTYQLRLGVVDRLSGKIGTIDVPLTIESNLAKK
jgi:VWFA-related protein